MDKRAGNTATVIKTIVLFTLTLLGVILGRMLLHEDFKVYLNWWAIILALGVIFMPFTSLIFHRFYDCGWLFSKAFGIVFCGWLMWYFSSIKIMKFTQTNCIISVAIFFFINLGVLLFIMKRKKKERELESISQSYDWKNQLFILWGEELLFYFIFLLWVYIRAFRPGAYGTEKFMDFGFMTSMMRTEYFPPTDFWLSGEKLNYYYFGQYLATYLTKLSGIAVGNGYNLMMMMLAAFGFTMPFSISYNVLKTYLDKYYKVKNEAIGRKKKMLQRFLPISGGALAGVAVSFTSNLHYPIYSWIIPKIAPTFNIETKAYWFANSTRFIGYNPETADKTIHEFPAYSYIIGDLHAHVINMIFVFTVIALLFAFLLGRRQRMDAVRRKEEISKLSFAKEVFSPTVLVLGFFIGIFQMTNYWDFPIYYVVAGAVILFSNAVIYHFKWKAIQLTAVQAVLVLVVGAIVCLPFTHSFEAMSSAFYIAVAATPVYQFAILWALPVVAVGYYSISRYLKLQWVGAIVIPLKKSVSLDDQPEKKVKNRLYQYIEQLNIVDLFLIIIGLCAIGLIVLPELGYVKDIYSGDYKRANTMFKLTYQAYLMFGIFMGVVLLKMLFTGHGKLRKAISIVSLGLLLCTSTYVIHAVKAWYGDIFDSERYQGLDASSFIKKESEDDAAATAWLNEMVKGQPVILEANGDSYTYYQRVSVATGLPTVLGWRTHEWLWHGSDSGIYPPEQQQRVDDIKLIYTSEEEAKVKELIKQYEIEYIYVGKSEMDKYEEPLNHSLLRRLGDIVFESPETTEKEYATYIVKTTDIK